MKLFLLRHADVQNYDKFDYSVVDIGLSKKGKKQSEKLASALGRHHFGAIFVSPLRRAQDTLKPYLRRHRNRKVEISPLIIERNLGIFAGTKKGTFRKYIEENHLDHIRYRPKNGESTEDAYKRAEKFLALLKKRHTGQSVLVCSHGHFLRSLEKVARGIPVEDYSSVAGFELGEMRMLNVHD